MAALTVKTVKLPAPRKQYLSIAEASQYLGVGRDVIMAELRRKDGKHLQHLEIGNVKKMRREALAKHFLELEV